MDGRGKKHERGQSLVEFALALPILILILSGLIDIGRVYFAYIFLEEAAAEAALYISLNPLCIDAVDCPNPNNAEWRAQRSGSTQGIVAANLLEIEFEDSMGTPQIGDLVEVKVTMPFLFVTPGMSALMESINNARGNSNGDVLILSVDATHLVITE